MRPELLHPELMHPELDWCLELEQREMARVCHSHIECLLENFATADFFSCNSPETGRSRSSML